MYLYKDIPLETKEGGIIDVEFVGEEYSFNDEQVIQCSVYDISGRKQIENARILARKNLNMFSGMTRHDILNQLMVVSGSLELASYGLQDPDLLQHLNRAQAGFKKYSAADYIFQGIRKSRIDSPGMAIGISGHSSGILRAAGRCNHPRPAGRFH